MVMSDAVIKPSIHLVYALHPRRRYCLASLGECRENPLLSVNNFVANPQTTLPELLFFQRQIGHPISNQITLLLELLSKFRYATVLIHVLDFNSTYPKPSNYVSSLFFKIYLKYTLKDTVYWIVHLATDAAQTRAIMLCAQRSVTRSAPIAYHVRIAKLYTFCHRERFEVARAANTASYLNEARSCDRKQPHTSHA